MKNFLKKSMVIGFLSLVCSGLQAKEINEKYEYPETDNIKTVIVAGGCFWCVESDFAKVKGIVDVVVGYSGGEGASPSYQEVSEQVGNGKGHKEVAYIVYDTKHISYPQMIDYFFRHIDPTDGDGQFCDRGQQYAPAIYYTNQDEKIWLEHYINTLNSKNILPAKSAVQLLARKPFYKAEEYHQNYHDKNPIRYEFYRYNCGRDKKIKQVWGAL